MKQFKICEESIEVIYRPFANNTSMIYISDCSPSQKFGSLVQASLEVEQPEDLFSGNIDIDIDEEDGQPKFNANILMGDRG